MAASKELWDKLRAAQKAKNKDASDAYRNAVDHANKDKVADAAWWERMGDEAMPVEKDDKEHAISRR
jgi:hypothetical protein